MRLHRSFNGVFQVTRRSFSSSNKAAAIDPNSSTDPTTHQKPQHASNHSRPITHFVFGANTDIGKTVLTAALIRAASAERTDKSGAHYIKPLQCGGSDESFVRKHAPNHLSSATTLFEWDTFSSPHFAARFEDKPVSDEQVLEALSDQLHRLEESSAPGFNEGTTNSSKDAASRPSCGSRTVGSSIWIETAGGVLSPSSSSPQNRTPHHAKNGAGGWGWRTQADLYRAFHDRSSVVLIGDGRLGGISSTLTALEALLHRNYTVGGILLIQGEGDSSSYDPNLEALQEYAASYPSLPSTENGIPPCGIFANPEKSILSLPTLPPEPEPLNEWYNSSDVQDQMASFVHDHLFQSYDLDRT